jgi:hypothetical protein
MIYLLVGCPCSGKSWVMSQLSTAYECIPHDLYIGQDYVGAIASRIDKATKPLLIETPFSMSVIVGPLEALGHKVTPVFIIESKPILEKRYNEREGKSMPKGHLTRTNTYLQRARDGDHFYGDSEQVLNYLRSKII